MKPTVEGSALYVYVIGSEDRLRDLFRSAKCPAGVEADVPLALVTEGALAAVVSEVSLTQFGEGRFEENLKDPMWAAERVMRHEKLAEFLATRLPVVPLRFGVMYSTPEKIREMLNSRSTKLKATLKQLADREEWGLNVYIDRKKLLEQLIELSPKLADLQKRAVASPPGQKYLLEKKLESLRAAESKPETKRIVGNIRSELELAAHSIKDLAVRDVEAKQDPAVAGKFSFLIDRTKLDAFRKKAESVAKKVAPYGFTLELTGPWPPYNFSE